VTVTPEEGPADCTITAFEPLDHVRMISGEINLVTSVLQGRIEAEGDRILLVKVAGSMPQIGRQVTSSERKDRS
jgi:putative sterol carrier protein